jgi:hypothetical protein
LNIAFPNETNCFNQAVLLYNKSILFGGPQPVFTLIWSIQPFTYLGAYTERQPSEQLPMQTVVINVKVNTFEKQQRL